MMTRKAACTPRMSPIIYALHSRTLSILDFIPGYCHNTLESHRVFPDYELLHTHFRPSRVSTVARPGMLSIAP
jgi:hypothetical protein